MGWKRSSPCYFSSAGLSPVWGWGHARGTFVSSSLDLLRIGQSMIIKLNYRSKLSDVIREISSGIYEDLIPSYFWIHLNCYPGYGSDRQNQDLQRTRNVPRWTNLLILMNGVNSHFQLNLIQCESSYLFAPSECDLHSDITTFACWLDRFLYLVSLLFRYRMLRIRSDLRQLPTHFPVEDVPMELPVAWLLKTFQNDWAFEFASKVLRT